MTEKSYSHREVTPPDDMARCAAERQAEADDRMLYVWCMFCGACGLGVIVGYVLRGLR